MEADRGQRWPRPTRWQGIALGLASLFLAGAVGYSIGTPGDRAPSDVDRGFLTDMIRHHNQALQLSNLVLEDGRDAMVAHQAREILRYQSYEVGVMESHLARLGADLRSAPATAMAWMGHAVPASDMVGMATEAEVDALAAARGAAADDLFLGLMIEHHRGGMHMARAAARRATDAAVTDMAETLERNQGLEVAELQASRRQLGLPPTPE